VKLLSDCRRFNTLILALLVLPVLFGGCASTPYQRTGNKIYGGYTSLRLSHDTYNVAFQGNENSKSSQVHDFALLRSAELTLENGFKYFVVINDQSKSLRNYSPNRSSGTFRVTEKQVIPRDLSTPRATHTTVEATPGSVSLIKPAYILTIQMYGDRPSLRKPSRYIYEAAPLIIQLNAKHKVK